MSGEGLGYCEDAGAEQLAVGVASTPARQAGTLFGRHRSHLVSSGKAQCWAEVYQAGPLRLIEAIHWMEKRNVCSRSSIWGTNPGLAPRVHVGQAKAGLRPHQLKHGALGDKR